MALSTCTNRSPEQWKASFSGVANNVCASCGSVDGDYILSRVAGSCTSYEYNFTSGPCGFAKVTVSISQSSSDGT